MLHTKGKCYILEEFIVLNVVLISRFYRKPSVTNVADRLRARLSAAILISSTHQHINFTNILLINVFCLLIGDSPAYTAFHKY